MSYVENFFVDVSFLLNDLVNVHKIYREQFNKKLLLKSGSHLNKVEIVPRIIK